MDQTEKNILADFFREHRQQIRMRLPHGSIKMIAGAIGVSNTVVDRALQAGWTPKHHADICRRAMLIISAAETDPDLIRAASESVSITL